MKKEQIVSTLENKVAQKTNIFNSSSTVFLGILNSDNQIDTEISLLNHFILKRGITDVVANFELHDLNGSLIKSFEINMDRECVYSIRLSNYLTKNFIGSVYVFFKSSQNLAVPFCAVMCSIKAKNSVCGVHTYGRRLEKKELGSNLDMKKTTETGWTVRDTKTVKSFSVLHGGQFKLELKLKIEILNFKGELIIIKKDIILKPYGTLILIPQYLDNRLIEHLKGQKGHAKTYIEGLKGVFPRMLCGNFNTSEIKEKQILYADEIQFTHTNFDFSSISQPDAGGDYGYYNQPSIPNGYAIVYPVNTDKTITISGNHYIPDTLHHIDVKSMSQVKVCAKNCNLPSRFVIAAVSKWKNSNLESECSTGTIIEDRLKVPCHWHWGLLKPGLDNGESIISIILNKFNRNINLNRTLKLRLFDEEKLLVDQDILIEGNKTINSKDFLPNIIVHGAIWFVLSGDVLEDLHIFSTFYPKDKAGFVEHSF